MKLFRFSLLLLLCGCALIKQDRILNEDIHLEGYLRIPGNHSNQELLLKRNGRFKWVILPLGPEEKQVFKGRFSLQGDSIYILDLKGDSATLSSDYRLHYKSLDSALRMMVIETNFNFRNRHWRVVQIGDDYVGMNLGPLPSLGFSDSIFGGNSGCNSFGGNFDQDSLDGIKFRNTSMTLLYCDNEPYEEAYLGQLLKTHYWSMPDASHLRLLDSNRREVLYFRRQGLIE